MNIDELKEEYKDKNFIPYSLLLATQEWQYKRGQIIQRDLNKCTNCEHRETISHYDKNTGRTSYFSYEDEIFLVNGLEVKELSDNLSLSDLPYHLEVHHKFYIINHLPWEYDDEDLITLCNWCHWKFHQTNQVKIYSEDKLSDLNYSPCMRCNGAGWFPEYIKIEGGICFRCGGVRFEELIR